MTTKTPVLELTEVSRAETAAADSFNASMRALDALVQLSVVSATETAPPAAPEQGDRYIVPVDAGSPSVAGEFVGHERAVAFYTLDGWQFVQPRVGWLAWVQDQGAWHRYDGEQWVEALASADRQILTAAGLSGGGNLSEDRTIALDLPGLDEAAALDSSADLLLLYDASAAAHRHLTVGEVVGGGSLPGSANTGAVAVFDGTSWVPAVISPYGAARESAMNAADDYFVFESDVDTGAGSPITTRRPGATPWTWRNKNGSLTSSIVDGCLSLVSTGSETSFNILTQPTSGTSWEYVCHFSFRSSTYQTIIGMAAIVNSSSKMLTHTKTWQSGGKYYEAQRWNSASSFSSTPSAPAWLSDDGGYFDWCYFKVGYDGTTVKFSVSRTGLPKSFKTLYSEASATFLGAAPDRIALVFRQNAAVEGAGFFDLFRKVA